MDLERERRFHELLLEALEVPPEARREFLVDACGDDPELLTEVWQAAAPEETSLGDFLQRPAVAVAPPELSPLESATGATVADLGKMAASPAVRVVRRLWRTPGVSIFLLVLLAMPVLIMAAITGAAARLGGADTDLTVSGLSGHVARESDRWPGVRAGDEIIAINGTPIAGNDARQVRAALMALEPGPVTLRFRRAGREWELVGEAPRTSLARQAIFWVRAFTGILLLAISVVAFILRPGARASWLFLVFACGLGVHLLGYMALLRDPPTGIIVESLGMYLAAASGLHFFSEFPARLLRWGGWALPCYLPLVAAAAVMLPRYRDPDAYSLMVSTVRFGSVMAAVAACLAAVLVLCQLYRAWQVQDAVNLARSQALLVAVILGLALPAVLGTVPVFQGPAASAANSFLVVVFVALTAYSMVRHNILEVDRLTASVLASSITLLALAAGLGALVLGARGLAGNSQQLQSPLAGAIVATLFFLLFPVVHRGVRGQVDGWFLGTGNEGGSPLQRLRRLADSLRSDELGKILRVGLNAATSLGGERAEVWLREPRGVVVRMLSSDMAGVPAGESVSADGVLIGALAGGSGGVDGWADRLLPSAAQRELEGLGLVLAAPLRGRERLLGFIALARRRRNTPYSLHERTFLDTIAAHLSIAVDRNRDHAERLGPYHLLGRLGRGGMAEVILAEKQGPGGFQLPVALKRILPHLDDDPTCVAMFLDEARIAAQLLHPHVVRIYDVEAYQGSYYLVMEFMDGPTLRTLIAAAAGRGTLLPLPVVAALATAVLSALEYAHQRRDRQDRPLGLVHRDVKPGNILLSRQGEVKLADFGIARAELRLAQSQPGMVRGSPAYMAPEQVRGDAVSPAADLYSAAAVIYELLTGQRAFSGPVRTPPPPPSEVNPALPTGLDAFFARALQERPEDRFSSAREMSDAFLAAIHPVVPATAPELATYVEVLVPPGSELDSSTGVRSRPPG